MNVLRIIGLVLIFPIILISFFVLMTGASMRPFLHEQTYKQVMEDNDLYTYAKAEISRMDDEFMQGMFENESAEDTISRFLKDALAFARGETRDLELNVFIGAEEQKFFDMFEQQAERIPVCVAGQSMYSYGEPTCRPSNMSIQEFLGEAMGEQGMPIPKNGKINLVQMFDKDNFALEVQQYIQTSHKVFYAAFAGLIVLLIASFFLKRRSLSGWFRYISAPLIIVGLLGIAASIAARKVGLSQIPEFEGRVFARDAIMDLAGVLLGNLILYGGLLFGIGIVLIVLSFVFKGKR
ncbi:hypothetical protein CL632_01675 [bacterium]|jgi:hypothetical protein|nr:hypothetical protein [bacterium]MDP6571792.1 hypothetical protein [Patescibacteria group bacterium]MDP6756326.1 hypothetical protein [Patescibacteria group bacterium]|tara:strand:- start:9686 stop:10567 length:882 start_codon:yes stop_codon:yes gene_type:complete